MQIKSSMARMSPQSMREEYERAKKEKNPAEREAILKGLHHQCQLIVSERRRAYSTACSVNVTNVPADKVEEVIAAARKNFPKGCFNAKKEYDSIRREIFGKCVRLVPTIKQIAAQKEREAKDFAKRSPFSLMGMSKKDSDEADKYIDGVGEVAAVMAPGTALKEAARKKVDTGS